jgi:hypothetical protein
MCHVYYRETSNFPSACKALKRFWHTLLHIFPLHFSEEFYGKICFETGYGRTSWFSMSYIYMKQRNGGVKKLKNIDKIYKTRSSKGYRRERIVVGRKYDNERRALSVPVLSLLAANLCLYYTTLCSTFRPLFLEAFEKLRKAMSFISVRLFFRPSAWNNSSSTRRIFTRSDIWVFLENLARKYVSINSDKNNGYFTWRPNTLLTISRSIILRMKNVSDNLCRDSRNTLHVQYFSFKSCRLWDNVGKHCTVGQYGAWTKRSGYLLGYKHTLRICNTYCFPLQKWLHKDVSMYALIYAMSLLYFYTSTYGSRLATGWTVRGSNPGGGEIFRTRPNQPWGPPRLLYTMGTGSFPGVKLSGRGTDHPPPPSAEVENG